MRHHFTKVHNICDMVIKPIKLCNKDTIGEREYEYDYIYALPLPIDTLVVDINMVEI